MTIIGSYLFMNSNNKNDIVIDNNEFISSIVIVDEDSSTFYVDVKGAVNKPGVYEFSVGNMVIDAISSSGGLKKNASTDNINLSKKLKAEMVIYIKTKSEINPTDVCSCLSCPECICETNNDDNSSENVNHLVNINSATIDELMTISGIGESKAISIINYRNNSPFTKIEDIMNVSGIGESVFNKIKDKITI